MVWVEKPGEWKNANARFDHWKQWGKKMNDGSYEKVEQHWNEILIFIDFPNLFSKFGCWVVVEVFFSGWRRRLEGSEGSHLMINNNDRELKELGSPKDKLALERKRESVYTWKQSRNQKRVLGEMLSPSRGCEWARRRRTVLSSAHWGDFWRFHLQLEVKWLHTSPWKAKFVFTPSWGLMTPWERGSSFAEIVFCRLNCPDCNTDQREVWLLPCCIEQGAMWKSN